MQLCSNRFTGLPVYRFVILDSKGSNCDSKTRKPVDHVIRQKRAICRRIFYVIYRGVLSEMISFRFLSTLLLSLFHRLLSSQLFLHIIVVSYLLDGNFLRLFLYLYLPLYLFFLEIGF